MLISDLLLYLEDRSNMNMRATTRPSCILLIWLAAGTMGAAQRGAPQPNRPDNPQSLQHLDAAKKTAGDDAFLANPYNFFCIAGNARAQNNNAPVLAEGQPFVFGDLTVTPIAIPGHTPGSLAFIFPVKENGRTRTAGLFGGTVLTTGILTTDALKQYTQSIAHYLETARKLNVEVELQNHPIFDGTPERLARIKSAKPGDTNPFVVGNDRYIKMWNIVSECIQAEIARREGA